MVESNKKCISPEDLAKHNKPGDLWISIQGKIYNVSDWAKSHPGGELPLLNLAGQDITDAFVAYHPSSAWQHRDQFFNGLVPFSLRCLDRSKTVLQRNSGHRRGGARQRERPSGFGCQEYTAAELNGGGCGGCELWALQVQETKSIWELGDPRW